MSSWVTVVDQKSIQIIRGLRLFLFESHAWAPNSWISFSFLLNLAWNFAISLPQKKKKKKKKKFCDISFQSFWMFSNEDRLIAANQINWKKKVQKCHAQNNCPVLPSPFNPSHKIRDPAATIHYSWATSRVFKTRSPRVLVPKWSILNPCPPLLLLTLSFFLSHSFPHKIIFKKIKNLLECV
jgi:hypothetical protein